jgi:lipopolysaccharide-binding protein
MKTLTFFGCVVLSYALLVVLAMAAPTGVHVTIYDSAFTEIVKSTQPVVTTLLEATPIPDITGTTDTPIGTIAYTLSVIKFVSIDLGEILITDVTNGISLGSSGASGHITLDWHYKCTTCFIRFSDRGSADVTFDLSVALDTIITASKGEPVLTVDSDAVELSNFNIELHGGASWLYQVFVNIFTHQIKEAVEKNLESSLAHAINDQGNAVLATAPLLVQLDPWVDLYYGMTANPIFDPSHLTSFHAGSFVSKAQPTVTCPESSSPLPESINFDMLQVFFSQYVANCAGYIYTRANVLHHTVTQVNLPANFPVQMNTTYFKQLIPTLYQSYPNEAMTIYVYAETPPISVFNESGAFVWGSFFLNVSVVGSSSRQVFTLLMDVSTQVDIAVAAGNLTGKVSFVNLALSQVSSTIGVIDVSQLDSVVGFGIQDIMLPWINKLFGIGIPIPIVDGVKVVDAEVTYANGYIGYTTNFTFTPPTWE